jgi:multiple sugar transport system ATP-binding protein
MASITYRHVSKHYSADTIAVKDLNLEIKDSEFMVLVGPSGCGKTTALRMLAGLEEITEGDIEIGGSIVNHLAPRDRDVAMVFQSYALYPHMTVYDNLAFGMRMHGKSKAEIAKRVGEAAGMLGLEQLLKRKPRQLSGGQRQRVALGRAIVRHPKAYLLDEPLSNLDAKLRVQTRLELQKQHRTLGATFVYVTHDQVEAMTMGDRIAVMRDGVLQQCATPRELYNKPANTYVAGFIGSPTMSFIPVHIRDGRCAVANGFSVDLHRPIKADHAILGIRPEALTEQVRDDRGLLEMKVDVIEILGSDQFLYGTCGGDSLAARVEPSLKVAAGDSVRLGLDRRHLHLFDADTNEAIFDHHLPDQ